MLYSPALGRTTGLFHARFRCLKTDVGEDGSNSALESVQTLGFGPVHNVEKGQRVREHVLSEWLHC